MKKNDFAAFVAYVVMFGIAILVGLVWIRPIVSNVGNSLPINSILLVFIGIVAGILLNSVLMELGHLLGARIGKYRVVYWSILGLGVKTTKEGKKKFGYVKFDGLTGETKVAPKDKEKSRLVAYISFPILFYLIELIVLVVLLSVGANLARKTPSFGWVQILSLVILTVGGMIIIYDYLPFRLDSITDGYLMMLLSKPVNKVAYNNMLLAEESSLLGKELPDIPVYDEVTDFTYFLNNVTVYSLLSKGSIKEAIKILDKAIASEKGLSKSLIREAKTFKLSLLFTYNFPQGKELYDSFEDEDRKYISSISTPSALRCYLLISGLIEDSETEANFAIDKTDKVYKSVANNVAPIEKKLLEEDVALVKQKHPSWSLYDLPWDIKKEKEEDSNKENK